MGIILCATRGGEGSIRTQRAAIERAKAKGDSLKFLFVFDLEFLAQADFTLRSEVVTEEIDKLGEFLMTMAVERAEKQGVKATYSICHGDFASELKAVIRDEQPDFVVLGHPLKEDNRFEVEALRALAKEIHAETGVDCEILP